MHASSTLPAFVLSQNQTLHKEILRPRAAPSRARPGRWPRDSSRAGSRRGTFAVPFPCLLRHVRHPSCRGPGPLRSGDGAPGVAGWRIYCIVQWLSDSKERVGASASAGGFSRAALAVRRLPWAGAAFRAATGRYSTPAGRPNASENFREMHFVCKRLKRNTPQMAPSALPRGWTRKTGRRERAPCPVPGRGRPVHASCTTWDTYALGATTDYASDFRPRPAG